MHELILNESTVPELYLYDEIGTWHDAISAQSVLDALEKIGTVPEIVVRINSPGGEVFEGIAIYQALSRYRGKVRVEIDALAASMASVIAMAGDEVVMAGNALMMVHRACTMAWGNIEDLAKVMDALAKADEMFIDTYDARTGDSSTREEIAAWVSDETWMSAAETVERGFATRVGELKGVEPSAIPEGRYRHAPANLKTKAATILREPPAAPPAAPDDHRAGLRYLPAIAARLADVRGRLGP